MYRLIMCCVVSLILLSCQSSDEIPADAQEHLTGHEHKSGTAAGTVPPLPDLVAGHDGTILSWVSHAEGKFEPCGCVAGMFGGLVRRGTLTNRVPASVLLQIEGGGWVAGDADYQLLKTQYYLRGLKTAGVHAVGIGAAELRLKQEQLQKLLQHGEQLQLPILACNLYDADGNALATPYVRVSVNGQQYFITAVVPSINSATFKVGDPFKDLYRVLAKAEDATVLVIADLSVERLHEIAQRVPAIDVLIGGDVTGSSKEVETVGQCKILYTANHGKTLGWWPVGQDHCAFELIKDTIPDDAALRAIVSSYQIALADTPFDIDKAHSGRTRLGQSKAVYVGDKQCMVCHQQAHAVFAASRHAHSYETLLKKSYHNDPDCLRCHVTGLGLKSGFTRSNAPDFLKKVSCESCHGPGSIHMTNRSKGIVNQDMLQIVTAGTCMQCHDQENSPEFKYETYWPHISH